jgi:hypothetical protein
LQSVSTIEDGHSAAAKQLKAAALVQDEKRVSATNQRLAAEARRDKFSEAMLAHGPKTSELQKMIHDKYNVLERLLTAREVIARVNPAQLQLEDLESAVGASARYEQEQGDASAEAWRRCEGAASLEIKRSEAILVLQRFCSVVREIRRLRLEAEGVEKDLDEIRTRWALRLQRRFRAKQRRQAAEWRVMRIHAYIALHVVVVLRAERKHLEHYKAARELESGIRMWAAVGQLRLLKHKKAHREEQGAAMLLQSLARKRFQINLLNNRIRDLRPRGWMARLHRIHRIAPDTAGGEEASSEGNLGRGVGFRAVNAACRDMEMMVAAKYETVLEKDMSEEDAARRRNEVAAAEAPAGRGTVGVSVAARVFQA